MVPHDRVLGQGPAGEAYNASGCLRPGWSSRSANIIVYALYYTHTLRSPPAWLRHAYVESRTASNIIKVTEVRSADISSLIKVREMVFYLTPRLSRSVPVLQLR